MGISQTDIALGLLRDGCASKNKRIECLASVTRTKDPRKNNLMKLVLLENVIQVIVAACMMRKRSKGFVRSLLHSRL